MRGGRLMVVAAVLGASLPASIGVATAATPLATPAALPVAWQAASAARLNEPALTPNGVVTTAGNAAVSRGLLHGRLLWSRAVPRQSGNDVFLHAPTLTGNMIDS